MKSEKCGSWRSPITAGRVAGLSTRLGGCVAGLDGCLTWIEGRPGEGGRNVIVHRAADGTTADVTPASFNVRSRVHEYGGGAYTTDGDEFFFMNDADQNLYRQALGGEPRRVTGDGPWRLGDLCFDHARQRILAVGETSDEGSGIVAVNLHDGTLEILARGHDFYASPGIDPAGRRLAWLSWNLPHMPWAAAALWVADLDQHGMPCNARHVAGDEHASVFQPQWHPDGTLYFAFEPDGFWNLYRLHVDGPAARVELVCAIDAEMGLPLWELGTSVWGFSGAQEVTCMLVRDGRTEIARIDLHTGQVNALPSPFEAIGALTAAPGRALVLEGASGRGSTLAAVDTASGRAGIIRRGDPTPLDPALQPVPETITFPTTEGDVAYGFFYPPRNPDFTTAPGEKPPLLVVAHGGPTGAASPAPNPTIAYWTTRGFAVLDVNYRGSTGFGRRYRDRLRGQWGVFDVDDCVAGARHVAAAGKVDPQRMAIRGSSAGGYTALAAVTFRDVFAAAAVYYGISDLAALARGTHKFERGYNSWLMGPRSQSPIDFPERITCPVIFFHGLDDRVVPPSQTETMVATLRSRGVTAEYLAFQGEGHGFRKAETIERALVAELAFYGRVFGFTPSRTR